MSSPGRGRSKPPSQRQAQHGREQQGRGIKKGVTKKLVKASTTEEGRQLHFKQNGRQNKGSKPLTDIQTNPAILITPAETEYPVIDSSSGVERRGSRYDRTHLVINMSEGGTEIHQGTRNSEDVTDGMRSSLTPNHISDFNRKKPNQGASQKTDGKQEGTTDSLNSICNATIGPPGIVRFTGFGREVTQSKFAKLDLETGYEDVWNELNSDKWQMRKPKFLISVTGGGPGFKPKPELESLFQYGLAETALTTDAWIITDGTAPGVAEMVGKAMYDHKTETGRGIYERCVVLGIAEWESLANKEAFEKEVEIGKEVEYTETDVKGQVPRLDANHSHFLLKCTGTCGKSEVQKFRSELEKFIAKKIVLEMEKVRDDASKLGSRGANRTQEIDFITPLVLFVIDGGFSTIQTVHESIKKDTPIIVINGSGRAADFISLAYNKINKNPAKGKKQPDIDTKLKSEAKKMLKWESEDEIQTFINQIKEKLKLITIFNLKPDSSKNFEQAIAAALLKVRSSDSGNLALLELVLAWNKVDMARQLIFRTKITDWNKYLKRFFIEALVQNKADFVELFLENGMDLKHLKLCILKDIFSNSVNSDTSAKRLWGIIKKTEEGNTEIKIKLSDINDVITGLLGDDTFKIFSEDCEKNGKESLKYPERDLFIFSILLNRRQMAKLFLIQGIDQVVTSLFGSSLLKAMSREAESAYETSTSLDLKNHAGELEHFAVSVINECYQHDKDKAHMILTREVTQLGRTTALMIVNGNELMDFAEQTACQTKLTKIWRGNAPALSHWKTLFTILMPLLIFYFEFERKKSGDNKHLRPVVRCPNQNGGGTEVPTSTKTCCNVRKPQWFRNLNKFHKAPRTKFQINILSYLAFLALFSYFLLTNMRPITEEDSPSCIEFFVWFWFFSLICEEFRQIQTTNQRSFCSKLSKWISIFWNKFDLAISFGVILSIILRFSVPESEFLFVRVVYSITLAMFYLRLLQYFIVGKHIGPKVIMIRKMLLDLVLFFLIFAVFILSFGVAYHINLYPNSPASWTILFNILLYPYFQIFGELFIDRFQGDDDDCTTDEAIWRSDPTRRCPEENPLVLVMLGVYLVLTNILLVNLLIAMFSFTFQRVQENSAKVWRYIRIALVFEYFDRPSLCPPFIIFNHIWRAIFYFCPNFSKKKDKERKALDPKTYKELTMLEKDATKVHMAHSSLKTNQELDNKIDGLVKSLEEMKEFKPLQVIDGNSKGQSN